MAAELDTAILKDALIVLGAAAIVVPVFHSVKLSPVLGYILIGMVVGPFGLGALADGAPWLAYLTIEDKDDIALLAEFGVVLLLFMIGLELSFERLKVMLRLVLGLGPAQLMLSASAIGAIASLFVDDLATAIVIGLALAMSSTAIVTQILAEEKQMALTHGRASFSVLVFQDFAVVPVLFAVSVLGSQEAEGSLAARFALALAQAALAVFAVLVAGRLALRPLFRRVAATASPELFMAACLLVILATGLTMAWAGLSMSMGALIAGLLLAETEYRRQIEVVIEPFKGLLVGVFLISIGMNVDLGYILAEPAAVVLASVGVVALKASIVAASAVTLGLGLSAGLRSGLVLGPASEFSFIIVAFAASLGLIDAATMSFLLIVVALTMAAIPLLHMLGAPLEARLAPAGPHPATLIPLPADETPRVIIAGFGRVGRVVAALLEAHALPYIAVDADPDAVAAGRDEGKPVYYGNIKHTEFLRRLGLETATALVITMDAPKSASEVVALARRLAAEVKIIVRARDAGHASELYRLGATDAVPETVEASLQLGEAVLVDVGIPMGPAIASIHEKRAEIRGQIQAAAPEAVIAASPRRRLRDAKQPELE